MAVKIPQYAFCPTCKNFHDMHTWKVRYEFCGVCGTKLINECPSCKKPLCTEGDCCTQCGHRIITR
jgi:hypothetical protein